MNAQTDFALSLLLKKRRTIARIALLALSMLSLVLIAFPSTPVNAQGGTVVLLDPSSSTVSVGATTVVNVRIENVSNLAGAEIHLTYNSGFVDVTQVEAGGFPAPDFVAQNVFGAGKVDYAIAQMPAQHQPVSGSGVLVKITFKGKSAGTSSLSFTSVTLANSGGTKISATSQNGSIQVPGQQGPTSTFTPTFTRTNTPSGPTNTPTTTPSGPTNTPTPTRTRTATAVPGNAFARVIPSPINTWVGNLAIAKIGIERASNLYAIELEVSYDAAIVECVRSDPGWIPRPDIIALNACANGGAFYSVTQRAPRPPAYGNGEIVQLTFRCLQSGSTPISFRRARITDRDGLTLPFTTYDGQITCAARQTGASYHYVRSGETLFCIGRAYGVSPWAIASENGLVYPYFLYVGQRLIIPNVPWQSPPGPVCQRQDNPLPPEPPRCRLTYIVQYGDTLSYLAWQFHTTVQAIVTANNLANANWIFAGQPLCIP